MLVKKPDSEDEAPWTRAFVTRCAEVADGEMRIPTAPGWGAEVNEEAVRAHPVRGA